MTYTRMYPRPPVIRLIHALAALLLILLASHARAQTAASLSPSPMLQFFEGSTGVALPCVNCTVSTFAAGTNTPLKTYTDSTATTQNQLVITLNPQGYSTSGIWIAASCYKYVLTNALGVIVWSQDHICDNAQLLKAALASSSGAANVGYNLGVTGSQTTTIAAKLNSSYELVADFGADPSGSSVANAAVQAMATASHTSGICGHMQGGSYKLVSTGATIGSTGHVCLYGDGQDNTILVENASNATTFATTGTYNHFSSFRVSPAAGTSGGTAFLDGGGTNSLTGDNFYDNIRVQNQQNAGFFMYGLHVMTSPNSDDNELNVTNSFFVAGQGAGSAGIYLDRQHAAHTINAFHISNTNFDGLGTDPIYAILCAACGEGSITNIGLFDSVKINFANGNGDATAIGSIYNSVAGISGEFSFPIVTLGTLASNNSVALPYLDFDNVAAAVTDLSGGNNFTPVAGGTHQEDMGPTGRFPRFGIGLFQGGNGGSPSTAGPIQTGNQTEERADWDGNTSFSFHYPNLKCMPSTNLNNDCGFLNFAPGIGGTGWTFGAGRDYDSDFLFNITQNNNARNGALMTFQHSRTNNSVFGAVVSQFPDPDYFTFQPFDDATSTTIESHRMLVDGTLLFIQSTTRGPCNGAHLGGLWTQKGTSGGADSHVYYCGYRSSALAWQTVF